MPDKNTRPNDGGSYRRKKDGSYQRLDQPQTANPGKTALRRQGDAPKEAGKATEGGTTNVRNLRGKDKE